MTKVPKTSLCYENDLFLTAQAILAELLRRDKNYSVNRKIEEKVHVCCREQAIFLAGILKSQQELEVGLLSMLTLKKIKQETIGLQNIIVNKKINRF